MDQANNYIELLWNYFKYGVNNGILYEYHSTTEPETAELSSGKQIRTCTHYTITFTI